MGLSAFAPIIHAASIFPYEQLDQQAGLRYYYIEGLVIVVGVLFYAVRYFSRMGWRRMKLIGGRHISRSREDPEALTFGDHLTSYSTSQS